MEQENDITIESAEPTLDTPRVSPATIESPLPLAVNGTVTSTDVRDVLSKPDKAHFPRNRGGANTHTNPNCACFSCVARRRPKTPIAFPDGNGGGSLVSVEDAEKAINRTRTTIVAEEYNPNSSKRQSAKVRVAQWLGTKAIEPELSNAEIARRMGISAQALRASISKGVQEGWLKFEDPIQAIEYQIIPKVVRNLNHFLDEGDKQVTIETAKGTLFKTFAEASGATQGPQTVLALKIELPERPTDEMKVVAGKIVGRPRSLSDSEV